MTSVRKDFGILNQGMVVRVALAMLSVASISLATHTPANVIAGPEWEVWLVTHALRAFMVFHRMDANVSAIGIQTLIEIDGKIEKS